MLTIHRSGSSKKCFSIGIILFFLFCWFVYEQWFDFSEDEIFKYQRAILRHKVNRTHYPKEAFVTITNSRKNYVQLLDILLDSVHLFSKRPVIVFTVDFDLIINQTRHSRVIVERISQYDCGPNIFACKLLAIVSSEVKYGVQLEVDSVVNYNIDLLFDVLHVWPYDLPLAPKHPDDPRNYRYYMRKYRVRSRSTPYMHAAFAWTFRAYPFLEHILALMQRGAFQDANADETAMNVMLWKVKNNHTLCKYDPYGPLYIDKYEQLQNISTCSPYCDGVYLVFHGQKESSVSQNIFERLQQLGPNRPFVQTRQGLKYFNDTNVTCCHPSATRPSSLHPLLCEYDQYNQK